MLLLVPEDELLVELVVLVPPREIVVELRAALTVKSASTVLAIDPVVAFDVR